MSKIKLILITIIILGVISYNIGYNYGKSIAVDYTVETDEDSV